MRPTPANIEKFKKFRSIYKSIIRKAKFMHYEQKFKENSKNIKKTWATINEVLGKIKKQFTIPDTFKDKDRTYNGKQEVADGFNEFFSSVGKDLADKIVTSKSKFTEFLPLPQEQNFIFANITEEIVMDTLKEIKGKKSQGVDNISACLLKEIMPIILVPVVYLFNLSIRTGYVPPSYKCAKIVPIFKSGDLGHFTNYRPISLLSSFSKLLEKIISKQMFKYLNKYDILYEHQYGFRPKHSTIHPLIHFLDKIYDALNKDEPEYTLGVFLDLKKAFDTVDHSILLKKLNNYGFRGTTLEWFKNYLNDRTQYVSIDNCNSKLQNVNCGVPQGSVLGPLLFLIYINDMPNSTKMFTSLFADDTGLFLSHHNIETLIDNANSELEKASSWFKANKLTLNVSKTKFIVFRKQNMHIRMDKCNLMIGNETIERIGKGCTEESFKFVGMKLDEHLTWKIHINQICKKVASANFALKSVKKILPKEIKVIVYNSLIKSHLEYGILAYGSCKPKELKQLIKLQKQSIRILSGKNYLSHTDPLFGKLGLLKLADIFKINVLSFMYNYNNTLVPKSFNDMFRPLHPPNRTNCYKLERTKCKTLDIFPKAQFPKIWNDTCIELKSSQTLKALKQKYFNSTVFEYNNFTCSTPDCVSCTLP